MKLFIAMLKLAAPMVAMQLGQILFGLVDIYFIGQISAVALAGVGLAHASIFGCLCFGIGAMLGIDTLASQAFGAGERQESIRVVQHNFLLAIPIALILIFLLSYVDVFYQIVGVAQDVRDIANQFVPLGKWLLLPAICFTALRQGFQAVQWAMPLVWIVVFANIINYFLNSIFVAGRFGFTPMGPSGSALSTLLANSSMLLMGMVGFYILCKRWQANFFPQSIDSNLLLRLLQLGIPAGIQFFLEVGVFSMSTAIMGKFGGIAAAAHQITIALASTAFMVPMGISFAAAAKVGQKIGENNLQEAKDAGNLALWMAIIFMGVSSLAFLLFSSFYLGIFTQDAAVISYAKKLIIFVAIFQIFDGAQVVSSGALRGKGETKISMWANFIGHWLVGFPLGLWLAFQQNWEGRGVWAGLCAGLICVALILFFRWQQALAPVKH